MTTIENNQQQLIKRLFQKEIECAQQLLQSLEHEYDALAEHHADALQQVVLEKQERIQQLEVISKQREKLLASFNGVVKIEDEAQSHNYHFDTDVQLTALWDQLVDIAEKCRDKNRINGSIVELVSKQSRHALDILHGILPESSSISELYNNAGQTTKSSDKRTIAQV